MTERERYICTRDAPWKPEMGGGVNHPDALGEGSCQGDCCDFYRCPNCGKWFSVKVPQ